MCYTSRELVEQVVADAREYFDKGGYQYAVCGNHKSPQWGTDFFAVEPMDNGSFCKCAKCQALLTGRDADSKYFSTGRHSDYFFNFVNEVAKEVAKTHPTKHIVTLAYASHAAYPEKIRLEPNVVVQYCFAANRLCYDRKPYEDEERQLKEWASKDKERPLYLWLYDTFPKEVAGNNWFAFPGYFAHATGEQFRLFKKLGVRGFFHCGYGQEVEAYLTFKLMDNPDLDVDDLLDEYFAESTEPPERA